MYVKTNKGRNIKSPPTITITEDLSVSHHLYLYLKKAP